MDAQSSNDALKRPMVATVVDNNDPKKWGRIRARPSTLFEGVPDEHLPWAIVSLQHPGGASAAHGRFEVPEVGAKVLLMFQNGNPMHPEYKGYFIDESTVLEEAKTNYPERTVMLWPSGSLLVIDKKSEDVFIRNKGDLHLYVTGDAYVKVDGNLTQKIGGNRLTFVAGDDITVVGGTFGAYAATMKLKASGTFGATGQGSASIYSGGTVYVKGSIFDFQGSGSDQAGSAPSEPSLPEWTGIRSPVPS